MNEEELNAIVDKMIAEGSSDDEIRAKLAELRSQPASTSEPEEEEQSVPVDEEALSGVIDNYATGFWSEEKLVPELYKILPNGWSVDEGISDGVEGGSRLSVNNLTLTSPNGVSKAFQIGERKTLANSIRDFMNSDEVVNAEPVKLETREEQLVRTISLT